MTASQLGLGVACLLSTACHAPLAAPSPLAMTVDSATYHRRGPTAVAVPFVVTNVGSAALNLAQCDGRPVAVLDRWSWGGWRFFEGGFCNGDQPAPLTLAPGTSAQGVVLLYEGGSYRLRVSARSAAPPGDADATSWKSFDIW